MSDNSANSALTPPKPIIPDNGVLPTSVWFVTGKKNNKAFRTALSLHRQNATLQETNIPNPSQEEHEEHPQQDKPKET